MSLLLPGYNARLTKSHLFFNLLSADGNCASRAKRRSSVSPTTTAAPVDLRPFALERYFAQYEFTTRFLLGSSDPETMSLSDLLSLEAGSERRLRELRLGYGDSRGSEELRHAIAALYAHADPNRILVHSGAQEPIFTFMNAVLGSGDHIIVQAPSYQSHYSIAEALGARVTRWDCDLAREGAPDVEQLDYLIVPATRAIVVTTPNNPTGGMGYGCSPTRSTAGWNARPNGFRRRPICTSEAFRLARWQRLTGSRACASGGSPAKTNRSSNASPPLKTTLPSATARPASSLPRWRCVIVNC
jgi:hypothetical protein